MEFRKVTETQISHVTGGGSQSNSTESPRQRVHCNALVMATKNSGIDESDRWHADTVMAGDGHPDSVCMDGQMKLNQIYGASRGKVTSRRFFGII